MRPAPRAALLFDIDGTLADTDRLHLEAFNTVFGPRGHSFTPKRFKAELQGFANSAIAARFLADETAAGRIAIMEEKEATFRTLAQAGVHPLEGLVDLLDRCDAIGLPYGAVTNAPRANAQLILDAIGLRERFHTIVLGDELTHGKPHPMPYLEGLRRLDADAAFSVAFEDSPSGVKSATSAGIATIGMLTSQTGDALRNAGAVHVAANYAEPELLAFIERTVGG
jgi:HAD superfamily hydrolase (TIGR01509 family)